jgi:HSP20 family protein
MCAPVKHHTCVNCTHIVFTLFDARKAGRGHVPGKAGSQNRTDYAIMAFVPTPLDEQAWRDDVRHAMRDLDDEAGRLQDVTGYVPPMDILERPDGLEIRVDLAGVPSAAVRVLVRGSRLLILGEKRAPCACTPGSAAFHVAERTFGRFARAVPLRMAFEASGIRAALKNGELRIVVPRLEDRRGREIEIPIDTL